MEMCSLSTDIIRVSPTIVGPLETLDSACVNLVLRS